MMTNQHHRAITLALAILALTWPAVPSKMWAETLTIEPSAEGGAIAAAVEKAQIGDIVLLRPGTYKGGFTIQRSITLKAETGAQLLLSREQSIVVDGAKDVTLQNLNIDTIASDAAKPSNTRLLVRGSENFTMTGCQIACGPEYGVTIVDSKKVKITDCHIIGTATVPGVYFDSDQFQLKDCIISGFSHAVYVNKGKGVSVTDNLLIKNHIGVFVKDGQIVLEKNTVTGPGNIGIQIAGGDIRVIGNSVRGFKFGVSAKAPAVGIVESNTINGNEIGLEAASYVVEFINNTVSHNLAVGIQALVPIIVRPEKDQMLMIEGNTVSSNLGAGIAVLQTHAVRLSRNLLENNSIGVYLFDAQAELVSNTIVLNEDKGVSVLSSSYAAIDRNIVSNNGTGIHRSQFSVVDLRSNVIFGNIVGQGATLIDTNFHKEAWMPLTDGTELLVRVLPALDLASETDVSIDPGFVKLGKDYRLRKNSSAVKHFGADIPGAFPIAK